MLQILPAEVILNCPTGYLVKGKLLPAEERQAARINQDRQTGRCLVVPVYLTETGASAGSLFNEG